MSVDSSGEQAGLDEFNTEQEDDEPDPEPEPVPDWADYDADKDRVSTIRCQKCGAENPPRVGRVLGNNDDELERGCFECSTIREINGNVDRVGTGAGVGAGGHR